MTDYNQPPGYRVGYGRPPLHSRFRKGQSGNPLGGRLHRAPEKRLAALLEAALDTPTARSPRPATRREAIVAALVEKGAAGDLRAVKLLLELMEQNARAEEASRDADGRTPQERLIALVDRLQAEREAAEAEADEPPLGTTEN